MAMRQLTTEEAFKYYQAFSVEDTSSDRASFLEDCKTNANHYFNSPWTDEDKTAMDVNGQYALSINKINKYITTITGMISSDKPMMKAVPYGDEDAMLTEIVNRCFSWIYQKSTGAVTLDRIVKGALRDNIGYAMIKQDEYNRTVFTYVAPDRIIVDSQSRDPFFRDANVIYYKQWMPVKQAAAIYGLSESDFVLEQPEDWRTMYRDDYTQIPIQNMIDNSKTMVQIVECYIKYLKRNDLGNVEVKLLKRTLLGYGHAHEEEMKEGITNYNIIPLYYDDTNTIYKRGMVFYLKELQRFLNKVYAVMIMNAQIVSNPKILVWKDQLLNGNVEEFKKNFSKPGAIIPLEGDPATSQPPIVVSGQPLGQAWIQMATIIQGALEFAAIPNQMVGMDSSSQGGGHRATQVYQQFEMMLNSLKEFLTTYETFISLLGATAIQYLFAYTDRREIEKVCGVDNHRKIIAKAYRNGLDLNNPQTVQAYKQGRAEAGENPIMVNLDVEKIQKSFDFIQLFNDITNDTTSIDFDIAVVKGSYISTYSMLAFAMKLELLGMNVVDNESVLDDAPLANKEEIKARVSAVRNLAQQNKEYEVKLAEMQRTIEMLQQQLTQGQVNLQLTQHQGKLDKDYTQKRATESQRIKSDSMSRQMQTKEMLMEQERRFEQIVSEYERATDEMKRAIIDAKSARKDSIPFDIGEVIKELKQGD